MKRISALILITAMMLAALLPLSVPAAADSLAVTFETSSSVPSGDVTFASSGSDSTFVLNSSDYAAAQFVLTGATARVWFSVTGQGSITVSLFFFDTDTATSLLTQPIVSHTFDNIAGKTYLSFVFDKSAYLAAGEYVLAFYDAAGVNLLARSAHESQRLFKKDTLQSKNALVIGADYDKKPSSLYGKPTAPSDDTEYDPAPHMASAIRFDSEASLACISSTNQLKVTYENEDGIGYAHMAPPTDADDPFAWLNVSGSPKTSEYKYLLIRCRLDDGCPLRGQFYVVTDANSSQVPWANTFFNYSKTTEWQSVIIKLEGLSKYSGLIESMRIDVVDHMSGTHTIDIQYMALFKSKEAAEQFDGDFSHYESETAPAPAETEPDYGTYSSSDEPTASEDGQIAENGVLPYIYKTYTHTMDFSESVDTYHAGSEFGFYNMDNAVIYNGSLHNKAFTSTAFFTRQTIGDAYGIRGGSLSFDLLMTHGSVTVTMRQMLVNDESQFSGIRFVLSSDGHLHIIDKDGFEVDADTDMDFSSVRRITLRDSDQEIALLCDDKLIYAVQFDTVTDTLSDGTNTAAAPHLPDAGYASVTLDCVIGYADNVTYTSTDLIRNEVKTTVPTDYSTWTATDDLGRTTPTQISVEGQKYVGLFYFMFHSHFAGRDAHDVTKIYLEGGTAAVNSTLSGWAGRDGAYWAEPYFGYYSSNDTWVFRKHAYMLNAAGVDFVFLDLSNGVCYEEQVKILFDTWLTMRKEGENTPQIVFMFGDMPSVFVNGVYTLLPFLQNPDYQELFFRWEDKPLILGNNDGTQGKNGRYKTWSCSDTTPQTAAQYKEFLNGNPTLKAFVENDINGILENFTVRKCWAWQTNEKRVGYWDWLQDTRQKAGRSFDGVIEQMAVSMGTHAHTNKGRSLLLEDTSYNTLGEFGYTLGTAKYGYHFAEQFEYALSQNVQVIMITGWNEWYAGVQSTSNQEQVCGGTTTPGYYMVDQMTPEYSRDGEPMRIRDGVGFGDNYYYQMVSYIRQFKGITAPETVNGGEMDLNAADIAAQWEGVLPLYTDTVGDCAYRCELGFTAEYRYVNGTARNDIATSQVSQSADKLYFYVTTAQKIAVLDDEFWMNLYINADGNTETGWEGYDFILNRSRTDKTVSVEAFKDGKWAFVSVGTAEYRLTENGLMLAIDKTLLGGKSGETMSFTFKWADNADIQGDVMHFMELGDAAPNDRFAFNAVFTSNEDQRPVETEPDTQADTEPAETVASETDFESATDAGEAGCKSALCIGFVLLTVLAGAGWMKRPNKDKSE